MPPPIGMEKPCGMDMGRRNAEAGGRGGGAWKFGRAVGKDGAPRGLAIGDPCGPTIGRAKDEAEYRGGRTGTEERDDDLGVAPPPRGRFGSPLTICQACEIPVLPRGVARGVLKTVGVPRRKVRPGRVVRFTTTTARSQGNTVNARDTWTNSNAKNPPKYGKNGSYTG